MNINIKNTYIINLDKDKERLDNSLLECKKAGINNPTRISGVYGKDLTESEITDNVEYVYSKIGLSSAIGCAMSHIKAWKKMIENGDDSALFLEDDVVFSTDFKERIKTLKVPEGFGIIYLGCNIGCDVNKKYSIEYPIAKIFVGKNRYTKKVVKINDNVYIPSIPLAMHAYILSRKCALYLLECIKKDKIQKHIDAQLIKYIKNVPSYSITPQLVHQSNIDINTSNNISSHYPVIINKYLSSKDKQGTPLNYKLTIGQYEILGYIVNAISGLVVIVGIILGLLNVKYNHILVGFLTFSLIELLEQIKNKKKFSPKDFIINTLVTFVVIIITFSITMQLQAFFTG